MRCNILKEKNQQIVNPNVSNFISSLRDMGYIFEVAVADVVDNSLSAEAKGVEILADPSSKSISILDDGIGMNSEELIEAMRLGSKDPSDERDTNDLGRFGLGLKTASFSQCKSLTVITKQLGKIETRRWDLDYIYETGQWYLLTPSEEELEDYIHFSKIKNMASGTIVIWENLNDSIIRQFTEEISNLQDHLSLVFHRFIEGRGSKKVKITVNGKILNPFDPFNEPNLATQKIVTEKLTINGGDFSVQPYILPHPSKLTSQEYKKFATKDGYTKSQGFYLYREQRLIIHGTWWGLNKTSDVHRLIRIKIDISNDMDTYWNIDIKKSTAVPHKEIKKELKRIIHKVLERGTRTYTGRAKVLGSSVEYPFWNVKIDDSLVCFELNKKHPLLLEMYEKTVEEVLPLMQAYLKGCEAYLPIDAIQAHMISEPHKVKQDELFLNEDVKELIENLRKVGVSDDRINEILKTEIFKNRKDTNK